MPYSTEIQKHNPNKINNIHSVRSGCDNQPLPLETALRRPSRHIGLNRYICSDYFRAVLCAVLFTILAACSGGDGGVNANAKLPFGFLDSPKANETIRGVYIIRGWALAEKGIKDVSVYFDRRYWGAAQVGGSRPDLLKLYPGIENAGSGGFEFPLDTNKIGEGSHEIVVQARSAEGVSRDIGSVMITIAR